MDKFDTDNCSQRFQLRKLRLGYSFYYYYTSHSYCLPMIPEELSIEQQAVQQAEQILSVLRNFRPQSTARLRSILDRLDTAFTQEAILDLVRLQPIDFTEAWYAGSGHRNSVLNYHLWRQTSHHSYELMKEFLAATKEAFSGIEDELPFFKPMSSGLRTPYDPVRELYLVFPEQVVGEGCDYTSLCRFYLNLLQVIPAEIEVVLLIKTSQIANQLRANPPRERIRYVVHSELESIWLRDYAGFNMGTHLVKPVFSPRRIGDNMKLLHSLLGIDLVPLNLVWDGGNMVTNGSHGFISTRLLKHNFKKQQQTLFDESPQELAGQLIRSSLKIDPVWVELPQTDKLAHTDGYITFISPTQALVSTFPAKWSRKYPEDQQCVDTGDPVRNEKGWPVKKSSEIISDIVGGTSYGGEDRDLEPDELGVLKVSAVTKGYFKAVPKALINKKLIKPRKGDLLFSRANTRELVAATCIVDKDYDNLFLPDKLWRIDLNTELCNAIYFKHLLSKPEFRNELTKTATGTSGSMLNVSMAKLRSLKLPLPPIESQNRFAEIVTQIEAQKAAMQHLQLQSDALFNSLLQRAFRGELGRAEPAGKAVAGQLSFTM
ncbi:restriction endonuclease subunit S [Hymenobacter aerilatus]|uniref:Restriction endonuclease subunit S n=1 Tax=Hymenobacter aerilatus TaxID=2932251 RepID=A0A8T9T2J4_9BACT|nr:restriction endonuclease subunit S [Hymenobacter aerilatus]UOR07404.1 restriction endonuclease subunit S [Hymenobacter aerilatus]